MVRRNNPSIITILRRYSKVITAFLVVNFITSIVYPLTSFALTSGPTAPEYSSFEPIDTSTMVNKLTGDMVYNVPLLEVPGPAGGYPLSLSYHAGIAPDVEASWVGLGWTLNPGSITRFVNGYADDHNEVIGVSRDFWEGGYTESYTVGVSFGIANMATASYGMTFAHDTYQGFDVGTSATFGVGFDLGGGLALGAQVSAGKTPYGGINTSAGVGLSIGGSVGSALGVSGTLGASVNSESGLDAGLSGGISYAEEVQGSDGEPAMRSASLMGASISSKGKGGVNAGIFGSYGFNNSKSGKISTDKMGLNFSIDVPTPIPGINIRLGRNKVRYWSDESSSVRTYGNLYNVNPASLADPVAEYDDRAEDVRDIANPVTAISPNYDLLKDMNGTVAGADYYNVSGQGISGNMKPFQYTSYLNRQNREVGGTYYHQNYHFASGDAESVPQFRFIGDFSNRLEYTLPSFQHSAGELTAGLDNNFQTGNGEPYGFVNDKLTGSKNVVYITNGQIKTGSAPAAFLETKAAVDGGFNRNSTEDDQIGGFIITNESGVSYHYSLPVYSKNEEIYTENLDQSGGEAFNHLQRPEPYAYTWLLTAVTGPDFVDRGGVSDGPNGQLDDADWGYWVEFDYGKVSDNYRWRNPSSGFNRDIDNGFQTFSIGEKEVYYLDAVRTKTHSALFLKDIRLDGKGVTTGDNIVATPGGTSVVVDNGGFEAVLRNDGSYDLPTPSLKLDKIILAENSDLPVINKTLSNSQPISGDIPQIAWNKTLDVYDELTLDLTSRATRVISFDTDYELQQGTPNSFANSFYDDADPTTFFDSYTREGKLTLQSIDFGGKQGASLVPPLEFDYANNPVFDEDAKDLWGFYKSDYAGRGDLNENLLRMTTVNSAANVDAWSLTNILSSLGNQVQISYESDDYSRSELVTNKAFIIDNISEHGSDELSIELSTFGLDLDDIFTVGEDVYPALTYTTTISFDVCTHLDFVDYTGLQIDPAEITYIDASTSTIRIRRPPLIPLPEIPVEPGCTSYSVDIQFTGGNLSYFSDNKTYGGGLRVSAVSLHTVTNPETTTTHYEYTVPGTNVSSGSTSYEPVTFDLYDDGLHPDAQNSLKQHLYAGFSDLLQKSSEVPGPGVMYEYVTVRESVTKDGTQNFVPGYSTYNYQTFTEAMVDYDDYDQQQTTSGTRRVTSQNVKIHDLTAQVGSLKSVTLYDLQDEKISETINHYLTDGILGSVNPIPNYDAALTQYDKQGVLAESFANARIVFNSFGSIDEDLVGVMTQKITYPSIQTGQTNINYRSGITSESKNLKFDFLSGQVLDTYERDKYGNEYVHTRVPAYRMNNSTAYPEMGPMTASSSNKNMLVQEGIKLSYKMTDLYDPVTHILSNSTVQGLIGGAVQTWSDGAVALAPGGTYSSSADQSGMYRKLSMYEFIGTSLPQDDGTYEISSYTDLQNSVNLVSNSPSISYGWQKNNEITLYDVYSHPLEAKDINGNYASMKMDLLQERVLATSSYSEYDEFTFSGAEDGDGEGAGTNYFGGGVSQPDGQRVHLFGIDGIDGTADDELTHTGLWSIAITSGNAFEYNGQLRNGRHYRALAWCDRETGIEFGVLVNNSSQSVVTKVLGRSNGWFLHEAIIPIDDGTSNYTADVDVLVQAIGDASKYVDDFRLMPIESEMSAYVYNEWGELSDILDQNNMYTHYEYDQMGRLKSITRETFKHGPVKVSETIINYARSNN